ncbi:CoA transferase [Rhodobacter sp. NTK016B]|uniref:CaiB/BaiF CoA-transferase family protein n=1 Tax=Rhodobacter sp. NTK016B TaxID=2759676 RepID=UPI001A8EFA9F|nr:CoA transferase [Rhodobacter sp. NTK016B]MBN8292455.1 CoA transferase [Rhodobacter sp. NTK016B]
MFALSNLVVVDASETIAGQYCGRLLAMFGADVRLIEPEGGSALRCAHPRSEVWGDSWLFFHLNLDKTPEVLDWRTQDGWEAFCTRAAAAQIVLIPQGMDTDTLRTRAPHTVFCEIGDFDERGPYAGWKGSEIVFQALAGTMYRNGAVGREPLFGVGHRTSYMTGIATYCAALAALNRAGGDLIKISVHTTAAASSYQVANQFLQNGSWDLRDGPLQVAELVLPCNNGWVVVFIHALKWSEYCGYFSLEAIETDPRFATDHVARIQHLDEVIAATARVSRLRDAKQVMADLQAMGIPAMLAFKPGDLDRSEHFRQRDYWQQVDTDEGPRRAMGPVWRMGTSQWRCGTPRSTEDQPPAPKGDGKDAPLTGIRILDLTTAWAGPMSSRILTALGADVVHVESAGRLDMARGNPLGDHPARYVDAEPGAHPYERTVFFNAQNLHKKSLAIDIKRPGGREALRAVAAECDVVLGNFSPGALARMGLAYEDLKTLNPRLNYLEMPACGTWGPMAPFTGLGPNMEFAAGMSAFIGYDDDRPYSTGPAYMDPIGGLNGAAAILTALHQRRVTGQGQYIELSQVEGGMSVIGELILDSLERGEDPVPTGNDLPGVPLHDAFRCRGHESWLAIVCRNAEDLDILTQQMASDGFSLDRDALKHSVAEWTATREKHGLAARLQAAGVAAAPVMHGKDVALDAHLHAIGFFDRISHPDFGPQYYQGLPFRFQDAPLPNLSHAPLLGQHSAEILSEWAGLTTEEIQSLHDVGAVGFSTDEPFAAMRG